MFKKLKEKINRPRRPLTRKTLLAFMAWQILWVGTAFAFSLLDLHGVMHVRASGLLPFLFMSTGLTLALYIDIVEGGLASNQKGTNAIPEHAEVADTPPTA